MGSQARQQEVVSGAGTDPAADLGRQEEEGSLSPKSSYQKNKVAREQLSLQLLMHLNGEQMASIKVRKKPTVRSRLLPRTHHLWLRSFPEPGSLKHTYLVFYFILFFNRHFSFPA